MAAMTRSETTERAESEKMQVVVQTGYGGAEVLQLVARARPRPGPREVLVKVHAAGLDRGAWHLMTGRPYLVRLVTGLLRPRQPVLGRDVAGTVLEVGEGVSRFKPGDEVFGIARGSFAELAVAQEDKLARKPAGLS